MVAFLKTNVIMIFTVYRISDIKRKGGSCEKETLSDLQTKDKKEKTTYEESSDSHSPLRCACIK